jgi:copper homeostasis protein (lipoprotein)
MNHKTLKSPLLLIGALVAVALVIAGLYRNYEQPKKYQWPETKNAVACPTDKKTCNDGSSVGKIPPLCEFMPCPEERKNVPGPSVLENGSKPMPFVGTFSGTFPCADCSGIQTELKLSHDEGTLQKGAFILKEQYIDRGRPIITTGLWQLTPGTNVDPQASVYELTSLGKEAETTYYLKVGDNELVLLDNQKAKIDSPFNFTLKKE